MLTNRQLFLAHVAQTSPAPLALEIESAQGMYMWSASGKKYMDLIAGISVSNIGHSNARVVAAVKQQAEKYMHLMVYGEFVETPQVKFARKLATQLPQNLQSVYFTNSGAEATEGAMKLAKRVTGRRQIISFKQSYHGSTQGALSILGDEYFKRAYRPLLPDVLQLEYGNTHALSAISTQTAAVFAEPIQAESGVTVPSVEFMQALRKRCTDMGAMLVLDEAQTGLGRTGKIFAFEHFGVVPDILLLAKALGGGMPLGAFISSNQHMLQLTERPVLGHITTFGGHPVSCAAGYEALCVLEQEKLIEEVEAKGRLFQQLLADEAGLKLNRFGLMMAVEFSSFEENKKIIDRCIENGILTDWFLFAPHCMRIAPPLIITENEIREACQIITDAVKYCS